MANISLATLNGIPGVDLATMTQVNPNACGAYAIIGAVGAHGVFPRTRVLAYANPGPEQVNNIAIIGILDNYTELSAAAYRVTGILNIPRWSRPVNPELFAAGNVYNSPAAMAKVAIDLGRPAPQIKVQAPGLKFLTDLYPNEQARCTAVVGLANVDVAAGNYARPHLNETHVVCVSLANGGLHWVAQGSDGNFYDPGNGSLNNAWDPKQTGDQMGVYIFTGLWMVIG